MKSNKWLCLVVPETKCNLKLGPASSTLNTATLTLQVFLVLGRGNLGSVMEFLREMFRRLIVYMKILMPNGQKQLKVSN